MTEKNTEEVKELSVIGKLSQEFNKDNVKQRNLTRADGNVVVLDYVPGRYIIERLNEVFGMAWSFEVVDKIVDTNIYHIAVHGRLTVKYADKDTGSMETCAKEQWGGTWIARNIKGQVISLGDDMKIATTDALKKCATELGVALYLYDNEDTVQVLNPKVEIPEEKVGELRQAVAEQPVSPNPDADKAMTEQQKTALLSILEKEEVKVEELLKSLKLEKIEDINYTLAASLVTKQHSFWK